MKKSILIVFLHGFGDNIMATPSVRKLAEQYNVDIVTYKKTLAANLWRHLTYVRNVYEIDLPWHPRYWNPLAFFLKDYLLIKHVVQSTVPLNPYSRVVFSKIYLLPHILYHYFPFLLKRHHKIDQIAYEFGIPNLIDKTTEIVIPLINKKEGERFLRERDISGTEPLVALHLTTDDGRRDFTIPLAQQLVDKLTSAVPNIKFVVLGRKESRIQEHKRYAMPLMGDNVFPTYNESGQEELLTNAYLISKSRLFIGIDSGPFHVAGALNVPTIGVFRAPFIKSTQRMAFNENVYCFDSKAIDVGAIYEKALVLLGPSPF